MQSGTESLTSLHNSSICSGLPGSSLANVVAIGSKGRVSLHYLLFVPIDNVLKVFERVTAICVDRIGRDRSPDVWLVLLLTHRLLR